MADQIPSIESLLREVKSRGMRVSNLFHRMDGMWQANLRDKAAIRYFDFGCGPDAAGALEAALEKAAKGTAVRGRRTSDDDLDPTEIGIVRHENIAPASGSDAPNVHVVFSSEAEDDLIG